MKIYAVITFVLLFGTIIPVASHYSLHGVYNAAQIGSSFFLWLNVIISFWELCLFFKIDLIEEQYKDFRERYKGRELDRVIHLFLSDITWPQIFHMSTWAEIWSTYSIFDDSYADRKSYGFFIDVGNGFSTPIPTLISIYGMTFHLLPARILGMIIMIVNYQMWYGTLVYFFSYLANKRYIGHLFFKVLIFVGISNGFWFTFPLWGIYSAYQMIMTNDYSVFLSSSF